MQVRVVSRLLFAHTEEFQTGQEEGTWWTESPHGAQCSSCPALTLSPIFTCYLNVVSKTEADILWWVFIIKLCEVDIALTSLLLLLPLLLSCFSAVRLCATPQTAAPQAPPSLWFSRQEHWSGLPFTSPMQESEKWKWSCSVVSDL